MTPISAASRGFVSDSWAFLLIQWRGWRRVHRIIHRCISRPIYQCMCRQFNCIYAFLFRAPRYPFLCRRCRHRRERYRLVLDGLMFYPSCFFLSPRNLRAHWADRRETLPHNRKLAEFYNASPKIREEALTKKIGGQKHAKFRSILYHFRL